MARAKTIDELEQRLIDHPDALDEWQVYADALSAAGDPRGELISVGVALAQAQAEPADKKAIKRLEQREQELLEANADAWFGKFVDQDDWRECFGWTLQTGFWGRIRLWVDYDHSGTDIPKALGHALAHPSAKFLRQLDLGLPNAEGEADYAGCIRALVKHGPLPSLRSLTIGDFEHPEESEISWVAVGDVGKLWPLLPNLETMVLRGGGIRLGTPSSKRLRSLELRTGGLPAAAAESLAEAELPALEHLLVWFGTENYGGSCTAEHARGILRNRAFKRLRSLGLANADFADAIAEEVVRAKLPASLERLDLSMGTMTDAGAQLLLDAADRFAGLEDLDLRRNFLSSAMCTRLRRALPNAQTKGQRQADGDWRYVAVGE